MRQNESKAHRVLKRLSLRWASENGYRIAAEEVALPHFRFRLDAAAYRPERIRNTAPASAGKSHWQAAVGYTAVFECKVSKSDFQRDAKSSPRLLESLERLHRRRLELERLLTLYYPSILNGDSLFQEFHTVDFSRPGHEEYDKTLKSISKLTSQLHANTKFEKLVRWNAANLFYVVAEPEAATLAEIPPGWGLLVRKGEALEGIAKPIFQNIAESDRLSLLHRIAITATRCGRRKNLPEAPDDETTTPP